MTSNQGGPAEGRFVDPRVVRLINAIRDMQLEPDVLDVHTTGLQMDGLHQVHVKRLDRKGRDGTLFQGNARAGFTELVVAVAEAAPLLEEFLASHWFAEVYDEVRHSNKQLAVFVDTVTKALKRMGVSRN